MTKCGCHSEKVNCVCMSCDSDRIPSKSNTVSLEARQMKRKKLMSDKHLASLNAKSNQQGLETSEVLEVLAKLIKSKDAKWKNDY